MTKITSFFQPARGGCKSKREREGTVATDNDVTKRSRAESKESNEVEELLSSLNDDNENASTSTWKKALEKQTKKPTFASLARFVAQERKTHTIYPKAEDTWAALNACPLDKIRVVIVGQDPYHGPNQAHGLCFSVLPGQAAPPSLKNMYRELADDPAVDFQKLPKHGHLLRWAQQGVLLLNTVLTVRKGEANSHKKKGWEEVTDEIIRAVDRRTKGCIFLLWGKPATSKALQLIDGKSKHTVICTSHPSPLGARKTDSPFLGSRCFSRCNEALKKMGQDPIDWNVEG